MDVDMDLCDPPNTTGIDSTTAHALAHASLPVAETYTSQNAQPRRYTKYNFTNIEDVGDWACATLNKGGKCEIRRLKGGSTNHVYLALNRREGKEGKVVFKHAAEQLSSDLTHALAVERMDYEARLLGLFAEEHISCVSALSFGGPGAPGEVTVRPAELTFYNKETKVLGMTCGGDWNLKDAYPMLKKHEIQDIGTALGIWLANLHAKTPKAHISKTVEGQNNNTTGVAIGRYSYANLHAALPEYGYKRELGRRYDELFGAKIAQDHECVCHGDFWPGNVVLDLVRPEGGPIDLTVIDWELARIGNSATDVGQFAAEAFLLDRCNGVTDGLHDAFIQAYFKTSAVSYGSKEIMYSWMTRVAVHFAVHLAFWPSRKNHWTPREHTKPLVDLAVGILRDATSAVPDVRNWRVFDGLKDLESIARDLVVNRGSP